MTAPRNFFSDAGDGPPVVMVDTNKLPRAYRGLAQDWFAYTADFLPLAASTAQIENVQVSDDAAFCLVKVTFVAASTDNLTRLTFAPALILVQDGSSNRNLADAETHIHNLVGTGEQPALVTPPRVFARASTIAVQLRNLEAVARNYRVALVGFKIFPAAD